jgi:hypothetical protein
MASKTKRDKFKKIKNSEVDKLSIQEFLADFKMKGHCIAQSARISERRFNEYMLGVGELNEFEINRIRAVLKTYAKQED